MITLAYLLFVLAVLFAGWRAWRRLHYFLHVFQLEGYKPPRYRDWLWTRGRDALVRRSHGLAVVVLALAAAGFYYASDVWTALILCPLWAITFASSRRYRRDQEKKPLAYTNRMKRLLATAALFTVLPIVAGGVAEAVLFDTLAGLWAYLLGFLVADLGAPCWVVLAAFLMKPVEAYFHRGFKRQARDTLQRRPYLQVIGITGSYGKTSTKFIIEDILSQRYNVLASPSSYNTPMGTCLVVNNQLRPEHQVLVLEYGIRYPGDIRELCAIATPHIAVITTIGVAHLETMGSIENIAREKGKLLDCLPPDGIAVLNVDDPYVASMAERAPGSVWRVSVADHPDADIVARDIRYDAEGSTFVVEDDTGTTCTFKTRLLGQHNVLNVLLGVAVGRTMGLRLRQMAHAVARIQPVDHRLQLRQEGAITIIDDAFNSNPVGARNAVEILGQFDSGRRVIVTPGMVELGERQWDENRTLGEHIARHADLAVLIGEQQTQPLREGLRAQNYPNDRVKVFPSLFDAQDFLKSYLRAGDVVLYENDLPDQYEEG